VDGRDRAAGPALEIDAVDPHRQAQLGRERRALLALQRPVIVVGRVEGLVGSMSRPSGLVKMWKPENGAEHGPAHPLLDEDRVHLGPQASGVVRRLGAGVRVPDDLQRGAAGGGGDRVGVKGARVLDALVARRLGALVIHALHDVRPPDDRPARQPAGEDLRQAREVGCDAVMGLRAAGRDAEAGHHLVEDQEGAVLLRHRPQSFEERLARRDLAEGGAGRLQDHRRDLVLLEELPDAVRIIGVGQEHARRQGLDDAGARRPVEAVGVAERHMVVPAVEMAAEPDDLRAPREGPGEAERHHGRFRADEVKRTSSAEGTISRTSAPQRSSPSWLDP
jgi:hypothetical protein